MSELLIGQSLDPSGPVSVLPGSAEEKAKQIPDPALITSCAFYRKLMISTTTGY